MIRAIMKQPVPDVVWQRSHSGVPVAGIPCIGIREGDAGRLEVRSNLPLQ